MLGAIKGVTRRWKVPSSRVQSHLYTFGASSLANYKPYNAVFRATRSHMPVSLGLGHKGSFQASGVITKSPRLGF